MQSGIFMLNFNNEGYEYVQYGAFHLSDSNINSDNLVVLCIYKESSGWTCFPLLLIALLLIVLMLI
jgi:hypothetical protein